MGRWSGGEVARRRGDDVEEAELEEVEVVVVVRRRGDDGGAGGGGGRPAFSIRSAGSHRVSRIEVIKVQIQIQYSDKLLVIIFPCIMYMSKSSSSMAIGISLRANCAFAPVAC